MVSKICPAVLLEAVDVEELAGQRDAGQWAGDTEGSAQVGMVVQHLGSLDSSDPKHRIVVDPDMAEPPAWVDSQAWLRSSLGLGSAQCFLPSSARQWLVWDE